MADSNDDQDHKDSYFDIIIRNILSQEVTMYNMEV